MYLLYYFSILFIFYTRLFFYFSCCALIRIIAHAYKLAVMGRLGTGCRESWTIKGFNLPSQFPRLGTQGPAFRFPFVCN